jgi:hypothetical protein
MAPTIGVTIASDELGLGTGGLPQIDAGVRRFPRERLVLRIVSVLNALAALGAQARSLSVDFTQILPAEARGRLLAALAKNNALFLEPWQHLVLLWRTLQMNPAELKPDLDFLTEPGETCYFDICRFASDTLRGSDPFRGQSAAGDPDAWVKIAANFMPWIWMVKPSRNGAKEWPADSQPSDSGRGRPGDSPELTHEIVKELHPCHWFPMRISWSPLKVG